MTFADAVKLCFSKYSVWGGRASRSEYWYFALLQIIAYVIALILDTVAGTYIFTIIVFLGLFLPGLAVLVRRLHDTGRSGGWFWISLIPFVGSFILFILTLLVSETGPNRYDEQEVAGAPSHRLV